MSRAESPEIDLHTKPVGNALWRAGAGAGKTFNLVRRVLRIAEEWSAAHDGRFPRLIVTTFTRMATQELRVRLMEAALKAAAEGRGELTPFVTSRSQLFVTTLHGVMDSFLRAFGSEIGLEPGFRVGGPDEIENLVRRVGKRILFPDVSAASTAAAKPAAASTAASDGDGVFSREAFCVDELLNEFDFGTTLRLLQRVSRVHADFVSLTGETDRARPAGRNDLLSSMAESLLEHASLIADLREEIILHSPDAKWNDFVQWLYDLIHELSKTRFDDLRLETLTELLAAEPKIVNSGKHKIDFGAGSKWKAPLKELGEVIASLADEVAALEKFEKVNHALAVIEQKFSAELRREKFRSGIIELEDLELLALELIRTAPDAATTYAEGWDHWLIDEYQDTSPRQVALIAALAKCRPLFVVGDPQQSIYLFRGARPGVFLERESQASTEAHEKVELLGNRRSHPGVMQFINSAVESLGTDFQKMTAERAKLENDGRRTSSIESPFGHAAFLALEAATGADGTGKIKALKIEEQRRIEAEHVSRAVTELLAIGASPASIAVLARSNKDLTIVAREFARLRIPFQVHTAGAYSDRLEVSDLCALLSFLSNPHDDENLIHLARSAWFPIGEDDLVRGYRRKTSLWNVLEETARSAPEALHEIEALQNGLVAARERGLVQAFREMLTSCDFFSWCGVLDPSGRREANALKFMSKLAVAERQAGFVPRRFVDEILGGGDRGGEGESNDRDAVAAVKPDRVHLMTIHVSKGLEFDHVFLPFLADAGGRGRGASDFVLHEVKKVWTVGLAVDEEGSFSAGPLAREWSSVLDAWGAEEQKRLLYVALTRARESLFLSATLQEGSEPKANSFLVFLGLDRSTGAHENYVTLSPDQVRGRDISSHVRRAKPRLPWGAIERKRLPNVYAGISVTRLLEMEDEEKKKSDLAAKSTAGERDAETRRISSRRSLSMATAAARGTRLHRVFELAKAEAGRENLAQEIARWFPEGEQDDAMNALQWLLKLERPNLSAILTNGEVEWSFTFVRNEFAVDGQIDLWGRDDQGLLWVIDYKTGDPYFKDKALRQLGYYAEALIAAGVARSSEEIALAALYPFSKDVFVETRMP